MGDNGKAIDGGVALETVEATTIELGPNQAALVMSLDEVLLALPDGGDEDFVPQHIMFLIGVYFMSADKAFVEKTIRYAIDKMREAEKLIEEEEKKPHITQLVE